LNSENTAGDNKPASAEPIKRKGDVLQNFYNAKGGGLTGRRRKSAENHLQKEKQRISIMEMSGNQLKKANSMNKF
jgi:hypothetical protein